MRLVAQLAALALIAAPILMISRSKPATYAVTPSIAIIPGSWIVQRALSVQNPIDRVATSLLATPERLALILLIVGLVHRTYCRQPIPRIKAESIL